MAALQYIAATGGIQVSTVAAGGYTAGSGTLNVAAGEGARFPSAGDFWVAIGSQADFLAGNGNIFKVASRATDALTGTGGQDGTSDTNAAAGAPVRWAMGPSALDQHVADQVQTGADASFAAAKAGRLYLPNNGVYVRRDSGAAGVPWGPVFPFTEPVLGDYTWVNQGAATAVSTYGGILLDIPGSATPSLRVLKKAAPSTPYAIVIAYVAIAEIADFANAGFVWRQSSDGKLLSIHSQWSTHVAGAPASGYLDSADWTSATAFSAGNTTKRFTPDGSSMRWLKLEDNGTNRIASVSATGKTWIPTFTEGRTTFLTADEVGIFANSQNSDPVQIHLLHWLEA